MIVEKENGGRLKGKKMRNWNWGKFLVDEKIEGKGGSVIDVSEIVTWVVKKGLRNYS